MNLKFAVLIGFNLLAVYSISTILSPLLPAIRSDLNLTPFIAGLIISAYGWTYAIMQVPVGIISDRHDPRKLMALSMFAFFLSAVLFSISYNEIALILSRLFMGFAASFVFVDSLKAIEYFYDLQERGRAVGIFVSIGSLGIVLPSLVVTFLPDVVINNWRFAYLVTSVLALAASMLSFAFLPRNLLDRHEVILIDANQRRARGRSFRLVWSRRLVLSNVISFVYFGTFIGILFWLPSFIESQSSILFLGGLSVALFGAGSIAGSIATGWLADLFRRKVLILTAFMSLYALFLLSIILTHSPVALMLSSFLIGFASGGFVAYTRLLGELTEKNTLGITYGIMNTSSWLGSAFYSVLIGSLLSYGIVFWMIFIIVAVSMLAPITVTMLIFAEITIDGKLNNN